MKKDAMLAGLVNEGDERRGGVTATADEVERRLTEESIEWVLLSCDRRTKVRT